MNFGDKLGPYEIVEPIGQGGMGAVYRARDTRLGRDVAIKVSEQRFGERFEREARVISSLNHPNICTLHDVGDNYLVMELVEGQTLSDRIKQGPIALEESLDIARQIGAALEAAHEKGIVHRDLKPGNVMLKEDGSVKVLDFGLAKVGPRTSSSSDGDNPDLSPTISMAATQAGVVLGTAAYMAPEQARGKVVDKRADIWAFGVVLYEMVTGKKLFAGEDLTDTLAAVVKIDPDISDAPPKIHRLLTRCLEKDPRKRLRDIGDAWGFLEDRPAEALPQAEARPTWQRLLWPAIAGVLAIVATIFAALWIQPAPLPEVTRFLVTAPPGSTLPLGTPAPSPDGKMLAYTVTGPDGQTRIHVRRMDRTDSRELPGTEAAIHPFWSPDSRSLAFIAQPELKRIEVDAGSPRVIAEGIAGPWHGAWSAKGDILALFPGIGRVSAQGASEPEPLQIPGGGHPFFLPDGERFLMANQEGGIKLGSLGSTETRVVLEGVGSAPILAQTPPGKTYLLYLVGPDLAAVEFDADRGTVSGEPFILIPNIGTVATPAVRPAVGVSRSGVLAYQNQASAGGVILSLYDRSGDVLRQLPEDADGTNPTFSPDGSMLATNRNGDIWITDLARDSSTRITFDGGALVATWAPEGDRVSVIVPPSNRIVRIDGAGEDETLTLEFEAWVGEWLSDDEVLAFSPEKGLMVMSLAGDSDPLVLGVLDFPPAGALSPDGRFVVFASRASGESEIYVRALPPGRGQTKVSINGGMQPHWNGDGTELYFFAPGGALMAVDTDLGDTFKIGLPHELFTLPALGTGGSYDVSPDGQSFAIAMPRRNQQRGAATTSPSSSTGGPTWNNKFRNA